MKKILKWEYTVQFKEQAVATVNNGRLVPEGASELGIIVQTLRNWVKAAERGRINEKAYSRTASGTRIGCSIPFTRLPADLFCLLAYRGRPKVLRNLVDQRWHHLLAGI